MKTLTTPPLSARLPRALSPMEPISRAGLEEIRRYWAKEAVPDGAARGLVLGCARRALDQALQGLADPAVS